jgi:hypothetical protein
MLDQVAEVSNMFVSDRKGRGQIGGVQEQVVVENIIGQ